MLKGICIFTLFAASLTAGATTYNISIGQSIDLQQGDVALVRAGGAISAVSCGGGGSTLPARQTFEITRETRFPDLFQTGADINREIQCGTTSGVQEINQAVADALYTARETCFSAGYHNCAQPVITNEQYSFHVRGFPGQYTCQVVARIIGTQP